MKQKNSTGAVAKIAVVAVCMYCSYYYTVPLEAVCWVSLPLPVTSCPVPSMLVTAPTRPPAFRSSSCQHSARDNHENTPRDEIWRALGVAVYEQNHVAGERCIPDGDAHRYGDAHHCLGPCYSTAVLRPSLL